MPWFKVDDGFANSEPVLRIPRRYRVAAVGLWTLAGTWCAKELTDGHVPDYLIKELGATEKNAQHLADADLWERTAKGWRFIGWEKYQPTRAQVLAEREKEAERKRKWRESRQRADECPPGTPPSVPPVSHPESRGESGIPDPARPDPTKKELSRDDPAPPVEQRGRKPRGGRAVADRLNGFAHSPRAHGIAEAWAKTHAQRPPGDSIGEVARAVDGCLESGYDETQIADGIRAWETSKFTLASKIPEFVHQVVNRRPKSAPSAVDDKVNSWLALANRPDTSKELPQ